MPQTITIIDVADILHQGVPCWFIHQQRDAGVFGHILPHSTLAVRAAEHAIDPADTSLLLDIVLHEPYMPSAGHVPDLTARLELAKTAVQIVSIESPADPLDIIRDHYNAQLAEAS